MEMRLHNRMISVSGTAAEIATVLDSVVWRVLPSGFEAAEDDYPPLTGDGLPESGLVSIWDDE